ncbi:MAG: toll/interleukin-1 receptor domain-containing protein, partial [Pseudomonadota bacterium]
MDHPNSIFVSYAHEDHAWLSLLTGHLAPWLRAKHLSVWSDRDLPVGLEWEPQIRAAMARASVAVLLVSKHFLASDFIMERELPFLLERRAQGELRIIPIAVGHGSIAATQLSRLQFANDPKEPLEALGAAEADRVMVEICTSISNAHTLSGLAFGLGLVDETTEPMEARLEGRPEEPTRSYGMTAHLAASDEEIRFENSLIRVTYDDLAALSEDDREYIADLERTMRARYAERQAAKDKLGSVGGLHDADYRQEMARVEKLMCEDLTSILDFLTKMMKYELEDH